MSRRPPKPLQRGIYLMPSLLTTGNLFAGYYAIVASLVGDFRGAAIAIGIAFVIDGLDGRIARMTNTQSEFGEVYDSIADIVTFGAAPAVLTLSWGLWDLGRVGWIASFFYLTCAAIRLARFSVKAADSDRRFFVGFPSPASAGLLAALAFYFPARVESIGAARGLVAIILLTALLMISKVRYRSFKDIDLRRRQPYWVIVMLATVIGLIALEPENVLLLLAIGYAASGPVERGLNRVWKRRRHARNVSVPGSTRE